MSAFSVSRAIRYLPATKRKGNGACMTGADKREKPIAVFDSGVGGISVLREMVRLMPCEDFVYFGDSENAPYGTKSTGDVRDLTISHVNDFLAEGDKAVAIACNTATSAAVAELRKMYPALPLVGIEPALKPAALYAAKTARKNVLVMATPMTIREGKFKHLLERYKGLANIIELPCPGLMEFVESGQFQSKEVGDFLEQILYDYRDNAVDAAVLGCTHYPFVRRQIQAVLGERVEIFDGAYGTAKELRRRIIEADLSHPDPARRGSVVFRNSAPNEEKLALCQRLLNYEP